MEITNCDKTTYIPSLLSIFNRIEISLGSRLRCCPVSAERAVLLCQELREIMVVNSTVFIMITPVQNTSKRNQTSSLMTNLSIKSCRSCSVILIPFW